MHTPAHFLKLHIMHGVHQFLKDRP